MASQLGICECVNIPDISTYVCMYVCTYYVPRVPPVVTAVIEMIAIKYPPKKTLSKNPRYVHAYIQKTTAACSCLC